MASIIIANNTPGPYNLYKGGNTVIVPGHGSVVVDSEAVEAADLDDATAKGYLRVAEYVETPAPSAAKAGNTEGGSPADGDK